MMRRLNLACAATLLFAAAAWADGKYWPEPAYPATPRIPLQRALIVFDNGIETLIVESSFESQSPSVGWVLPLPAEPTNLAAGDPGMLTSLSMSLRPDIVHDLHNWIVLFLGIPTVILPYALAIIFIRNRNRLNSAIMYITLLVVVVGFLLPGLGTAGSDIGPGAVAEVRSFQRVGNYDVAVLRAGTADALSTWLRDNGFKPLEGAEAKVVEDYLARAWYFVAAKLRRDAGGAATPHPLIATFPATVPVYPMKLTALAGSTVRVELFVVADRMADANGFRRTAADEFRLRTDGGAQGTAPYYEARRHEDFVIGNPDVGQFLREGCVVTKLEAHLVPGQMTRDVKIGLTALRPCRDRVCSPRGRREVMYIVLLGGLSVTLIASAGIFRRMRRPRSPELKALAIFAAFVLVFAGIIYAAAPVIPVRAGRDVGPFWMRGRLRDLRIATQMMAKDGRLHAGMTDEEFSKFPDMLEGYLRGPEKFAVNPLTGDKMRMERSPGNFSVRAVEGITYFCLYDADGREYRVKLPPADEAESTAPRIVVTHTPETQFKVGGLERLPDEELPDFPHPTEEEKAVAKGKALLKEGRLDEAQAAYGRNRWEFERDLQALGREAAANGRVRQALAFYVKLLGSRQCLLWDQVEINEWPDVDAEYLGLVEKAPANERDEAVTQDIAARDLFGRLKELLDARDFRSPEARRELYEIADVYLSKYPKARLALTALLGASCAAQNEEPAQGESPSAPGIRKFDELLARMRAAGRSRYDLDTVLSTIVTWTVEREKGDRVLTIRAREACEEIAREGKPDFRAEWLLGAADYSLQAREENGRRARRLYEEALAMCPGPPWGPQTRAGIVRTYTEIDGPDAGLAALRELEKQSPPDTDFSLGLSNLAEAYRQAKRPDQAIALVDEIVRRHPKSVTAARAFRKMAAIHKEAHDEPKMLAALENAAACLPPDQPLDIWDGCQRSFVYEELADYHVAKKNWTEGLRWSKAWKVQTGCGNCDGADLATRRGYIALCQAALGRADDALKSMEGVGSRRLGKAAVMLVDTFRERRALDELLPKLTAAAKSDKPDGARIALRYIELLRLVDAKDIVGLWKTLDTRDLPSDDEEWLKDEVPVLAGDLGQTAKSFLLEALAGGAHKDQALFALARMKAPEVLPILLERAKTEKEAYQLQPTFTALALFGSDEAYAAIERYAQEGTEPQKNAAREVLYQHPKPK